MKINTLMLIDDDQIDQLLHKRIVERSGFVDTILSYSYAEEALDYLRAETAPTPDVILLDVNMPRMDGFEFLDAFSRLPANMRKPIVVMLTTSLDPKDEARASQFGSVKGYLPKPLSPDSLQSIFKL